MNSAAGSRLALVIITRDRCGDLLRTLAHLQALPERPAVVVVDNGSRDGTPATVRRLHPEVTVIPLVANSGVAGRNVGVRLASCPYVGFAADDSWWSPGSLEAAVEIMETDPSVGLVGGRILVGPTGRVDPVSEAMAAGAVAADLATRPGGRRAVTGTVACATVVRSRAFLAVGGFPAEMLIGGEEQTLVWDLWAAGYRAVYAPESTALHHPDGRPGRSGRSAMVARNDVWAAWSRLPWRSAVGRTVEVLWRAGRHPGAAVGLARAARQARWPLARRARIPAGLERARRELAGAGLGRPQLLQGAAQQP